jgi:Na+-driven multidrug efflux pump
MAAVCLSNVGLNFLLVFHTPLGYHGIALSTVISVVIGSAVNSLHIRRFIGKSFTFSLELLSGVARIGWPTAIQQVSWQVGSTVMFLILSALPGNTVAIMAAFTNGLRIEAAIFMPAFALNMANAVVVGNMLGAGRKHDAFRGGIATALIGVVIISVLTVITLIHARALSAMLSGDAQVIAECTRYLLISMISEPFMAWGVILGGGLNGAGDTRSMMAVITGTFWLVRVPLAFALGVALGLGAPGVWWAMNASIAVNAVLLSLRYFRKRWISL